MFKKLVCLSIVILLIGCSSSQQKLPEETPEKVVERFFKLLGEGGASSLAEARRMVSDKYYLPSEENFKKWVGQYPASTKIKNLQSKIVKDKRDEKIAQVTLEYTVPSYFGGTYTAKSSVNLILDNKSNSWKIDFTAETLPEETYKEETYKKESGG